MLKKFVGFIVLIFILGYLLVFGFMLYYSKSKIDVKVDYIIVLGAKIIDDKPCSALQNRLDKAIEYYHENNSIKIVVTGGKGNDEKYPEALVMKNYLLSNKVKNSDIIMEDKSTNTYENLYNAKKLIDKDSKDVNQKKIGIITNDFHVLRTRMLFERIYTNKSYISSVNTKDDYLSFLREPLAIIKSFLLDK